MLARELQLVALCLIPRNSLAFCIARGDVLQSLHMEIVSVPKSPRFSLNNKSHENGILTKQWHCKTRDIHILKQSATGLANCRLDIGNLTGACATTLVHSTFTDPQGSREGLNTSLAGDRCPRREPPFF